MIQRTRLFRLSDREWRRPSARCAGPPLAESSRYSWSVADRPSAGREVQLKLVTRRFACETSPTDFRRAVRRGRCAAPGAPNSAAGRRRPLSWLGIRRQAGGKLCQEPHGPREQRHPAAARAAANLRADRAPGPPGRDCSAKRLSPFVPHTRHDGSRPV